MGEEFVQVITTLPDLDSAQRLAQFLVEQRLAACTQVSGPSRSTFHWQGKIDRADEFQCVAKIRARRFDEVAAAIKAQHPYQTPELIALPIVQITADYQAWLDQELP